MKEKLQNFLIKIGWPVCNGAEAPCLKIGKRRRRNTAYNEDENNFVFQCGSCFEIEEAHWADMWSDYNSGRL